jgi:hypothetical protein
MSATKKTPNPSWMTRLWRRWRLPMPMQGRAILPRRVQFPVTVARFGGRPCSAPLPPVFYRYPLDGGRAQMDQFGRSPLLVRKYPNKYHASFATRLATTSQNAQGYLPYSNEKRPPISRIISGAAKRLVKLSLRKVFKTVPGHKTSC